MESRFTVFIALLLLGGVAAAQSTEKGRFFSVEPVATVERGALRVKVGQTGEMQIETGADSYLVESCFSYPGVEIRRPDGTVDWKRGKIGWNGFPRSFNNGGSYPDVTRQVGNERSWAPVVRKTSVDTVIIEAEGRCYRLVRTVKVSDGRIDIEDQFSNKREYPTAVVPRHRVTAQEDFVGRFIAGAKRADAVYTLELAANPTLFLTTSRGGIGLVMQDNVSRRRYAYQVAEKGNRAGLQINRVVLDRGASRTFSWSLYVVSKGQNYFDFVNRVRRDWNANVTIDGPYAFGYLKPEGDDVLFYMAYSPKIFSVKAILKDPTDFRRYLEWRGERIIGVAPWLDYDPGAIDHFVTRDEYGKLFQTFLPEIRKAAPATRIVGLVETPYVTILDEQHKLPRAKVGEPTHSLQDELTPEQVRIIEKELGDMAACLIRNAKGKPILELCVRGGKPTAPAVRVFPEVGNARYALLMDQVKFLIDEVGLDGVYFDMFALGQWGSMRAYGVPWDGLSADICFETGEWRRPYKDCGLAAVQAKLNVLDYLFSRGKVVVANRQATSREEQTLPVYRFTETGSAVGACARTWRPGTQPPGLPYLFVTQLNTPIGLGVAGGGSEANDAPTRWMMKAAIIYLRHGMVFYPQGMPEPPMTEEHTEAFGVLKHMFPITPVELGEGFLVGKERILTAVSMDRLWRKDGKPSVLIFDIDARRIDPASRCTITQENGQWRVRLKLNDWAEVAVVE